MRVYDFFKHLNRLASNHYVAAAARERQEHFLH
jgi:hypothetical protein